MRIGLRILVAIVPIVMLARMGVLALPHSPPVVQPHVAFSAPTTKALKADMLEAIISAKGEVLLAGPMPALQAWQFAKNPALYPPGTQPRVLLEGQSAFKRALAYLDGKTEDHETGVVAQVGNPAK